MESSGKFNRRSKEKFGGKIELETSRLERKRGLGVGLRNVVVVFLDFPFALDDKTVPPTLTIKSLDLPLLSTDENRSISSVHSQRLSSKSCKLQKKLQIPNQVTINLRHMSRPQSNDSNLKIINFPSSQAPLPTARSQKSNRSRDRSLSTLIYELSDKTHFRNETNEGFEDIIREITIDGDELTHRKRLFRHESVNQNFASDGSEHKFKHQDESKYKYRKTKYVDTQRDLDEVINLTCGKIRIFEKLPRKRK
ncbi:hypothetical protein RUM43_013005 [Polyplax serrata]|uniref:Uncharacterized protein n=1 Tax=Polyplax serrata TaxID=468196 RepID=A0AAN8NRC8_POLSC